jgi:hypothetical protein
MNDVIQPTDLTPAEKLLTRLDEAYKRHLAEAAEVIQALTAMGEEAGVKPNDNLPLHLATVHLRKLERMDDFDLDALDEDEDGDED